MAITRTNQYQPLSQKETQTDDPVSVRMKDQWDGINNYASTPWPVQPSTSFPGTNSGNDISFESPATTGEQLMFASGRIYIPQQYDLIRWQVCHVGDSGQTWAGETVTWKLYVSDVAYTGTNATTAFDTTVLSFADNDSFTTSTSTNAIYICADGDRIAIPRLTYASVEWPVYFTITATPSVATHLARFYTLGITAEVGWMV